jgi:hypothetical protein
MCVVNSCRALQTCEAADYMVQTLYYVNLQSTERLLLA